MEHITVEMLKAYKGKNKHYEIFEDTIKYFSYEKWIVFINFVKMTEDRNRKRNVLIFQLLLSTGMRISEFSQIKVNDIDFDNCTINIPYENTKTAHRRTVRVKKEIMLDLKEYISQEKIKSGYIFRNKNNEAFSTRNFGKIFKKYFGSDKIKLNLNFVPHPHTLRHCHIVYAMQNNVPINSIMAQVGHLNLHTTQIYSKLAGCDIIQGYRDVEF